MCIALELVMSCFLLTGQDEEEESENQGRQRRGSVGVETSDNPGVAFVEEDSFAISPVTSLTQGVFCSLFAFSGLTRPV